MARRRVINKNQNEDLIGGNFTNVASSTVFSLGNFAVESNFANRRRRDYSNTLSSFAKEITLETLNLTSEESKNIFEFTNSVELNFDRSDIRSYVKFGSTAELFRVTHEQIILNYPASLFVSSQATVGGNSTFVDFQYDAFTNTTIFNVPSSIILNSFSLIFDNGNESIPNDNDLKNLNLSFERYVIWRKDMPSDNTHNLVGFTGDSENQLFITIKVNGNPFPEVSGTSGNIDFHVKPNLLEFNKFASNLNQLERYFISNRLENQSAFKISLKKITLLETGSVLYSDAEVLWNTTDGYNPNITGALYETFINTLLNIGREYDSVKTDLIARFLTPASLKVYDQTDDGKMTKLLRLYGREFDELRIFIDAIANINKVTYDKNNNIPDTLVKNLARTLGWDVFDLVTEQDITQSFFSTEVETREDNLLPSEIDIELWRRILINTNYYWKSKGTRHAIKSIFQLIGIPEPFINITEYVYTVEGKINPNEVTLSLEDIPSASFPFDNEGYPIAPVETPDFYFQISGNSDNGQAYINLYRDLGFRVNRVVDNKKSWTEEGFVERIHPSTPNYFQQDSRLLINTKEVDVTLDIARGIEYDVYCYNKDVDDPITSTGVTRPYIYINVELDVNDPTTFILPEIPLSGSAIQLNYNGITLTPPTGATGGIDYDYTYNITPSGASVTLNPALAVSATTGNDVITVSYLFDRLGGTGYTQVQYLVQAPTVLSNGTLIQLPEEPKGDIQLTVNGITMSKGTSLFSGDFIIDPNDRTRVLIQNSELQLYLTSNPVVRTWYIKDGNPTNAEKRSEVHRVDSFNSNKLFFNAGINKFVYVLDFAAFDIDAIKITVNGITLQNGNDFTLNPSNKRQVYLPPSINLGYVIGAYYIIDDGTFVPPLLPPDPTFPDISDISFLEYLELITRRLISVKRRKTISDNVSGYYPVVQNLYDEYLRRSFFDENDPLRSNGYTFENLYPFINQYNAFFNRFINQLLPATIILGKGGILIRNTAFTRQKYRYPRGVNLDQSFRWLGTDGSEFIVGQEEITYNWTDDFVCENIENPSASFFVSNIEIIEEEVPTTTTTTTLPPIPTLAVVGEAGRIFVSTDRGESWTLKGSGIGVTQFIRTVDFVSSDVGFAAGGNGFVWRTTNAGDSWTLIADNNSPIVAGATSTYNVVKGNNFNENIVWLGSTNSTSSLYESVNGGNTWSRRPSAGGLNHLSNDIYVQDEDNIISVSTISSNSIVKSVNGGNNWTTELNGAGVSKVDFINNSIGVGIDTAFSTGTAWRTTDGGNNWTNITSTIPLVNGSQSTNYAVSAIGANTIYIAGVAGSSQTLFKSTNNGLTWNDISSSLLSVNDIIASGMAWEDSDNGWILYRSGEVLKTINGGLSWTKITIQTFGSNMYDIAITR